MARLDLLSREGEAWITKLVPRRFYGSKTEIIGKPRLRRYRQKKYNVRHY